MKIRLVPAAAALFASTMAWAGTEVDRLATAQLECVQARSETAQKGQKNVSDCCGNRASVMSGFKRDACTNPARFCDAIRKMPEEQRLRQFVTAQCEPGGLTDFFGRAELAKEQSADYAEVMRKLWSCKRGKNRVADAKTTRPSLILEFACDAREVPFDCRDASKVEESLVGTTLLMYGAEARIDSGSGECVLGFSQYLVNPSKRSELLSGMESEARRMFAATREIIDHDQDRVVPYVDTLKLVFTPERVREIERKFSVSQEETLAYLKSVGAPEAVLKKVRDTELVDYATVLKKKPSKETVAFLEQLCRGDGSTAFGQYRAINSEVDGKQVITICPSQLLNFEAGNPRAIYSTFLHELGHSYDPCSLGETIRLKSFKKRDQYCNPPRSVMTSDLGRFYYEAVAPFSSCLYRSDVKRGREPELSEVLNSLAKIEQGLGIQQTDSGRCGGKDLVLPQDGGTGFDVFCRYHYKAEAMKSRVAEINLVIDRKKSIPSSVNDEIRRHEQRRKKYEAAPAQENQMNEAFSDYVSAQVLDRVMARSDYSEPSQSSLSEEDRVAEVLTVSVGRCFSPLAPLDEHPPGDYRFSMYMTAPGLRKRMGCGEIPASDQGASRKFASANCSFKFKP